MSLDSGTLSKESGTLFTEEQRSISPSLSLSELNISLKINYVIMLTYLLNLDVNMAAEEILGAADTDNAANDELDEVCPETASSSPY